MEIAIVSYGVDSQRHLLKHRWVSSNIRFYRHSLAPLLRGMWTTFVVPTQLTPKPIRADSRTNQFFSNARTKLFRLRRHQRTHGH